MTKQKINKSSLIEVISQDIGVSKAVVEEVLKSFISHITVNLKQGKQVGISGFGLFRISKRRPRRGVNPQTGKPINLNESATVAFKAGKTIKSAVQ